MEANNVRMAYIETELAKRYRRDTPAHTPDPAPAAGSEVNNLLSASSVPEREPASLGKLHEIDLGQEARLRNIARTEEARKRMNGDDDELSEHPTSRMPSRYQKRRTSDDIERDRLVEEVLRESKRQYKFFSKDLSGFEMNDQLLLNHLLTFTCHSGCIR